MKNLQLLKRTHLNLFIESYKDIFIPKVFNYCGKRIEYNEKNKKWYMDDTTVSLNKVKAIFLKMHNNTFEKN